MTVGSEQAAAFKSLDPPQDMVLSPSSDHHEQMKNARKHSKQRLQLD